MPDLPAPPPPQTNPHIQLLRGQVYASGQEERTPYAWPITSLPSEFDNPSHRVTDAHLRERLDLVRALFRDMGTNEWRHYKEGHVYTIIGFGVSARDGQIEVEYRRVDQPHRGTDVPFHLPIHEWFSTVILHESDPRNPNVIDPDAVFAVHRYVPVFKITRFETERQFKGRGE